MTNEYNVYCVRITDSNQRGVIDSKHETFEAAFAAWKELFLSKKENVIPYITKGQRTVFNGFDSIIDDEPILDLEAARENELKNENWTI